MPFLLPYAGASTVVANSGQFEGQAREIDFAAFWVAAKLLLAGDPAAALDQAAFRGAQELQSPSPVGELFWLYPPGWQFLLAPLGLSPFWGAWFSFVLISVIAFAGTAWRMATPVPSGRNLLIGAPAVAVVVALGQATRLWLAALMGVFHALERRRDVTAGLLLVFLRAMLVDRRTWEIAARRRPVILRPA